MAVSFMSVYKLGVPMTVSDEILQKKIKMVDELKDLVELIERK
jgi:hypothetical protein